MVQGALAKPERAKAPSYLQYEYAGTFQRGYQVALREEYAF